MNTTPAQRYAAAERAHDDARIMYRAVLMSPMATQDDIRAAKARWATACADFEAAYDRALQDGAAVLDRKATLG